ncbi:MAG: cation diffusion facilitator family transporter [Acidiferrobacteraceae bacterium]
MDAHARLLVDPRLRQDQRYFDSRRAIGVSMSVNLFVALAQIAIGFLGASQGLVAGGFESLSDLLTDTLILVAAKHSAKAADEDHPYGHARIETAASAALGALMIVLGAGLAIRGGLRVSMKSLPPPAMVTLAAAAVAILAKEMLYRYLLRVSRRINSNLLRASAWHYRSDAFSSIVIAIGIAGALAGVRYLDAVAAIGIALFIMKTGAEIGWRAARELVDTGLESDQLRRMRALILSVAGVRTLHQLRTRRTGGVVLVDLHIEVDGMVSVSEGHQISEAVRSKLVHEMEHVADVVVHIDPEDDETEAPSDHLPPRDVVLGRLRQYFADITQAARIERFQLHYLNGGIHVELVLPFASVTGCEDARLLQDRFRRAAQTDPDIRRVDVLFH